MKKSYWVWGIVILLVLYGIVSYNGFVRMNTAVDNQWAQVETQYQRRFDLIPNLVNSVKGILNQEQKVFGDIAEARTRYSGALASGSINEQVTAANEVEGALGRLLVIMENYPALQSSQNVKDLMTQLEGTENRISVERKRFNDAVAVLNAATQKFPSNLVARMFGFASREYFQAAAGSDVAPTVNL